MTLFCGQEQGRVGRIGLVGVDILESIRSEQTRIVPFEIIE
jgi:hypothetical protein